MKKYFLLLAVLLILAVTPFSAQEETLTVLCTPQEDWCIRMTEAFEEKTGIETSYVRMSSGESLARIRASATDPEFSVWWGGPADAYITATEEGLLESYDSPIAAELAPEYISAEKTWYGVYVGALGFCSNVELLEELGVEIPTSWDDLLNPALSEQIAMAHPATSGTAFTALWTEITQQANKLEYPDGMGDGSTEVVGTGEGFDEDGVPTQAAIDNAFAYFASFNNNILQYTRSGSAPGTMAGRGEVAVSVIFSHDCVKYQVEGFADVLELSFPEEGTGYEIGGVAVIANAPEPEAARMFLDFALSVEGQSTGQEVNSFQLPTNPNTPISDLSVDLSQVSLIEYNFIAAGLLRTELAERFDAEIAPRPTE